MNTLNDFNNKIENENNFIIELTLQREYYKCNKGFFWSGRTGSIKWLKENRDLNIEESNILIDRLLNKDHDLLISYLICMNSNNRLNNIEWIKEIRRITKWGLKESKEFYDNNKSLLS